MSAPERSAAVPGGWSKLHRLGHSRGRLFVRHADAMFTQREQLRTDLDAQSGGAFTEVRVGAFPTAIIGLGVSLVPRLAQIAAPPDVAIRPIDGEAPCRHLFAACARGAEGRPSLRAVMDALIEAHSPPLHLEAA